MSEVGTEFDDDVFVYGDWPTLRQCISGFGRDLIDDLEEYVNEETGYGISEIQKCKFQWQVNELVRWCRAFNRENHELKQDRDRLRKMLALSEPAYLTSINSAAPDVSFPGGRDGE